MHTRHRTPHLVEHRIGGLVAGQALLGQVLVALGQALHLSKPGYERIDL